MPLGLAQAAAVIAREPGQVISERRIPAALAAELAPGARVALLVDRVIWLALDNPSGCKAECFCPRPPPSARWFPVLSGVDVVAAGGPLGGSLALVLPHVAEIEALGDGHDHGHQLPPSADRGRGTDHDHFDQCNGLRG